MVINTYLFQKRNTNALVTILVIFILFPLLPERVSRGIPGFHVLQAGLVFVVLTFLPGYAILKFLNVDTRSSTKILLYSVGISIPYVLSSALLVNFLGIAVGISDPLSARTLTPAIALSILIPFVGATQNEPQLAVRHVGGDLIRFPRASLFLCLLPLLSVLGVYLLNNYGVNITALTVLCFLAFIPILVVYRPFPHSLTPLAIIVTSVAILFHTNLVSTHIWGWDIHYQYFIANTAYNTGYWDPQLPSSSTTLPMSTLVATVYSLLSGIELVWVYKIFYPVIVSLIPLGLYAWIRLFRDDSVAVLAPFIYMFFYGFFKDMPDKQFIGELYLVILLLLLFDREITGRQKWILGLVFALSMIMSHYVVSFVFIISSLFVFVSRYIIKNNKLTPPPRISNLQMTNPVFLISIGLFWIVWFSLLADGVVMESVLSVITDTFVDQGQVTAERSGADYATRSFGTPLWVLYYLFHVGLVALMTLGLVTQSYVNLIHGRASLNINYLLFANATFVFVGLSAIFPLGLGFDRVFKLGLIVLAPFVVIGWETTPLVCEKLLQRFLSIRTNIGTKLSLRSFAVFLLVFFLFSSGAVFAVSNEPVPPYTIGLDQEAGWPVYEQSEVETTRWIASHDPSAEPTVAVYNRWEVIKSRDGLLISEITAQSNILSIDPNQEAIYLDQGVHDENPYIYISNQPVGGTEGSYEYIDPTETPFYRHSILELDEVYDSGEATIYQPDDSENATNAR